MAHMIKLLYGPYPVCGIIKHRFLKIRGLYEALTNLGYEIELVETNLFNRLTIEMCSRKIFSCDIRNLLFNMDCEDDTVCQRAVAAVQEAFTRFDIDDIVPRYTSIDLGRRQLDMCLEAEDIPDLFYEIPWKWREIR